MRFQKRDWALIPRPRRHFSSAACLPVESLRPAGSRPAHTRTRVTPGGDTSHGGRALRLEDSRKPPSYIVAASASRSADTALEARLTGVIPLCPGVRSAVG